jgi:purine nucleosidase
MTRRVVLDVDPGCDDAAMIALALASDELDVVGVTTVAGNARLHDTTRNALAVLERLGRADVPVVPGCDRPLVEPLETAEEVHGTGGLPGERPDPSSAPTEGNAVSFLLEQSRRIEDLTVVATGPLTNVAAALAVDPALADRVAGIHVMGGAVGVGGNASAAAEYNFYADPEAAARVVRDANPRIVGLDVTERATLPPAKIEALARAGEPVRTIAGWLAYETPETVAREGVRASQPLHDPAVVVDLLSGVLDYETATLEVDHGSGVSRGALLRDEREAAAAPNAEVALDLDVGAFRATALDLLDGFAARKRRE